MAGILTAADLATLGANGITIEHVERLRKNKSRSRDSNLRALRPLVEPIVDAHGQRQIPLNALIAAGFTIENIVDVLNHDGGSVSLGALQDLLKPMVNAHELLQNECYRGSVDK